jgi:hypothetical protein
MVVLPTPLCVPAITMRGVRIIGSPPAAEAFCGCTIPVGVPVFGACPECGGTGQVFLFRCLECAGSGLLEEQRTLHVRVPPRVQPGTVLEVPLEMFGISNLHLRVQVSISDAR